MVSHLKRIKYNHFQHITICMMLLCYIVILSTEYADAAVIRSEMGENDCKGNMIINVGDIIIWTNNEEQPRKVVSVDESDKPDGIIQSEIIYYGESYIHRFTDVADYEYYCMKPHNKHGFIHVASTTDISQEFDSSIIKYEIPVWFEKLLYWYEQKYISTEDVLNSVKFLSENSL